MCELPTQIRGKPTEVASNTGLYAGLATSPLWNYGITLIFVSVALILEMLLQRFSPYPFLLLFFAAVIASAWNGGAGPGMFAVAISILAVDYFFIPPLHSLAINTAAAVYCAAFIISALFASWVSALKKKSEQALREARDQLEIRVDERTIELRQSNAELRKREHQLEESNTELRERERQLQLLFEEHKKAEQALMKTQGELTHLSRVLTMGELTSSIAHEITQPLTAVVIHGDAGLECLAANPPKIDEARQVLEKIIDDGTRAGAVLSRIRALFKKEPLARESVDVNEVIQELTVFLRDEARSHQLAIRTDLDSSLPKVVGDRIQLQQVVLNLIMNGIDAMADTTKRPMELLVTSQLQGQHEILVSVVDRGVGLPPELSEKIFEPFFTTKPEGIGMGLSISRSIIESHGGRLWATARASGGTVLSFTIPTTLSTHDG